MAPGSEDGAAPTNGYRVPAVPGDLTERFCGASPFPHIVLDDFVDEALLSEAEHDLRSLPLSTWLDHRDPTSGEMEQQKQKLAIRAAGVLPESCRAVMEFFSSGEMLQFFSQLTAIDGLHPDPGYLGGGVHRIDEGGKLSVHADFNIHPETGLHRRLNALLYLNKEWKPEYGGELELWDGAMSACQATVAPLFNRMMVFRITDDAFHGHPEPWRASGYARLSFAFYYYTDNRPEQEKSSFHWASWRERPGKGW